MPSVPSEHAASVEAIDETDSTTRDALRELGIVATQHTSYEWNGYRYSNSGDAIAAAKEVEALSRAMNLSLAESTVREHCQSNAVGISALEVLPGGGVRLVCSSTSGADVIRKKLKAKLISDDAKRTRLRPPRLQW